ncbi:hypothetical protein CWB99_15790 [Pseudoalteromonas rubra]|uniref:Uncharacterized protein n=1 Tax=Pseudoalteromonas rubra TaxID=43658 RepID=A0A5S3WIR7_9GAMM|nr:hypothetical protein [Pseudoalteromonas rubra]TMP27178.1 hypothetical protein CWB99_15790 [Pseudoalteromonas rubra]TMP29474.1 hypothetical protein CWC00_18885 [Pseudoalteromonas rubra]
MTLDLKKLTTDELSYLYNKVIPSLAGRGEIITDYGQFQIEGALGKKLVTVLTAEVRKELEKRIAASE